MSNNKTIYNELHDSVTSECSDDLFGQCALKVQDDYQMAGLAGDLYEEYARDIFREYMCRLAGNS